MTLKELIEQYRNDEIKTNTKKLDTLIKSYDENLKEIQKEIDSIYAHYTEDGELSISKRMRLKKLADIEIKLQEIAKELGIEENKIVKKALAESIQNTIKTTAYCVELGIANYTNLSILNDTATKKILETSFNGQIYSDFIWSNKEKLVKRIKRDVNKALVRGWDIRKISNELAKDFKTSKYESLRLVQSETARLASEATEEYYKENKDVIPRMRYEVTLDDKTSNICQELEGEYETGKCPTPVLDSHPMCRCVTVGVVEDWKPKWRIDNVTKEKIPYVSYKEWQKLRFKNL